MNILLKELGLKLNQMGYVYESLDSESSDSESDMNEVKKVFSIDESDAEVIVKDSSSKSVDDGIEENDTLGVPAMEDVSVPDMAAGPEIYESYILNPDSEEGGYEVSVAESSVEDLDSEKEKQRLAEYYVRWQNADASLFRTGWYNALRAIKKDIGTMLYLAGYDKAERQAIYDTQTNEWFSKVAIARKEKNKEERFRALNETHDSIFKLMSSLLEGRELQSELLEKVEIDESKSEDPKTLAESVEMIDEFKSEYADLHEYLKNHDGLNNSSVTEIEDIFTLIENNTERDSSIALNNNRKYLKKLREKMIVLRALVVDLKASNLESIVVSEAESEPLKEEINILVNENKTEAEKLESIYESLPSASTRHKLLIHYVEARTVCSQIQDVVSRLSEDNLQMSLDKIKALIIKFEEKSEFFLAEIKKLEPDFALENWVTKKPELKPDAEKLSDVSSDLEKYREKRASWNQEGGFNENFRKIKAEYNKGIKDYYDNRGWLDKAKSGTRSILGLKPSFPQELEILQAKYQTARKFYARDLSELLALRSKVHVEGAKEQNRDMSLNRAEVKKAFAQKFILTPAQKLLDIQMEKAMEEGDKSRLRKIAKLMSKHKWGIRAGTVVLAGTVGAFSGGASLALTMAGSRMLRMTAGTLGGMTAGVGVNRAMKGYVDTAESRTESAKESAKENFTLDDLESLEAELLEAKADEDTRKARRLAATVAVAGAAGFGAGYGAVHAGGEIVDSVVQEGAKDLPQGGSNPVGGLVTESTATKVAEVATEKAPDLQSVKLPVPIEIYTEHTNTFGLKHVVSDVEVQGKNIASISAEILTKLQQSIRLATDDVLAGRLNMPTDKISEIVNEKLQNKFGAEDWWKTAEIDQIKIGKVEVVDASATVGDTLSENTNPVTNTSEQPVQLSYEVKPGDNVSTIFHKNLLEQFDQGKVKLPEGMSRGELSKLMYTKFPELTDAKNPNWTLTPEEWKELGVKSGNPALIRPGVDNINVSKLLEKFNDTNLKPGQSGVAHQTGIPLRPGTGSLNVIPDSAERNVPIRVAVRPDEFGVPNAVDVVTSQDAPNLNNGDFDAVPPANPSINSDPSMTRVSYTERNEVPLTTESDAYSSKVNASVTDTKVTEAIYNGPKAPTIMSGVEGQYFKSPEFKAYLQSNGLTVEMMEKVVQKTVDDFEGSTYASKSEELFGGFDSPYNKLSNLSMKEVLLMGMKADGNEEMLMKSLQEQVPNANFKPETLRAWTQVINQIALTNKVPYVENTTIADVFERHLSQTIVEHKFKNNLTGAVTGGKRSFADILESQLKASARKDFVTNRVSVDLRASNR